VQFSDLPQSEKDAIITGIDLGLFVISIAEFDPDSGIKAAFGFASLATDFTKLSVQAIKNSQGAVVGFGVSSSGDAEGRTLAVSGAFAEQEPEDFLNSVPGSEQVYTAPNQPFSLDWTDSSNAEEYDVYLEKGDATPDDKVASVSVSNWTLNQSLTVGTWYWKVVAKNASGTNEGATWSFTIQQATHSISISASPSAGGDVSGGGTFDYGDSRTVTASENTGYDFVRWTDGGSEVSTNPSYTFPLTSNRSLVAEFAAQEEFKVIAFHGSPTAGYTIEWTAVPGYSYQVKFSSSLRADD
jgi:hypothetical protein